MQDKIEERKKAKANARWNFDDLVVEEEAFEENLKEKSKEVHWMPFGVWKSEFLNDYPGTSKEKVEEAWDELLSKTPAAKKKKEDDEWHVKKYLGIFEREKLIEGQRTSTKRTKSIADADDLKVVLEASNKRTLIAFLT